MRGEAIAGHGGGRVRLGDLLRTKEGQPPGSEAGHVRVEQIPIGRISPNPFQPRREFDPRELEELAASIRSEGLIQPVVVRPVEDGFQLVSGERRWRAFQQLGLREIPALVRDLDDEATAVAAAIENLQRKDLNLFEEAEAYARLLDRLSVTQSELGKRLGKSQAAIANKIRLLKLDGRVRQIISEEMLNERQARALLRIEGVDEQVAAAREMARLRLSSEESEALAKPEKEAKPKRSVKRIVKDLRIFLNGVDELVGQLGRVGIAATVNREESSEEIVVHIRIPRTQKGG